MKGPEHHIYGPEEYYITFQSLLTIYMDVNASNTLTSNPYKNNQVTLILIPEGLGNSHVMHIPISERGQTYHRNQPKLNTPHIKIGLKKHGAKHRG